MRTNKATEVRRTCTRCATVWYAPKKGVFTRPMSGGQLAVASTTLGLGVALHKAAGEKKCPICGSQKYEQVDATDDMVVTPQRPDDERKIR